MRLTQGTFSFLPDLTDTQVAAQLAYCIANDWAVSIEHTDDPHPRNTYWEMWGLPMFDAASPSVALAELDQCRAAHSESYIRVSAFDATRGWESVRLSFIVHRPSDEPGFRLRRHARDGRRISYEIVPYATERPEGRRYG